MVYREFAEALVRAAHLRHHATPGLDRRFAKMLSDAALPALAPDAPEALPWDEDVAKMLAGGSREGGDPRTHAAFASAATGGERADVRGRARSGGCLTVSGRAFLAYLASRGALADADAEGETIEIEPPSGEGEEGEEGEKNEEGAGGGGGCRGGGCRGGGCRGGGCQGWGCRGGGRGDRRGRRRRRGGGRRQRVFSRVRAAAAASVADDGARGGGLIAAIGPYAAHTAAIDEAEREAEEAAIEEEERQARYEAGEGSGGAEAALEDAAETADAAAEKAELAEARALAEGLDGEATFEEFVHALARCADATFEGDEEKTTLEEKMDAFLGDEAFLGL